jgi:hypothetical protein
MSNGEVVLREAALVTIGEERSRFMPLMRIEDALQRRQAIVEITRQVMVDGIDYGKIPGTDKPTLLKPGAEKLCSMFGLVPDFILIQRTEDWGGEDHGGEPFFYYFYKCRLLRNGIPVGEGEGSCNSRESKYRWRWVQEGEVPTGTNLSRAVQRQSRLSEPDFAIRKSETSGKYGKPSAYWERFKQAIASGEAVKVKKPKREGGEMDAWEIASVAYRIPNPDVADQVNTLQKMGQKRALIAATLIAVNASEFFTQDLDDFQGGPSEPEETQEQVAERRLTEERTRAAERHEEHNRGVEQNKHQPEGGGIYGAGVHGGAAGKPEEIPLVIQALWKRMTNMKEICDVFAYLKSQLGNDVEYYAILAKHGMQHSNDRVTFGVSRRCARELFERWQEWQAKQEASLDDAPIVDEPEMSPVPQGV